MRRYLLLAFALLFASPYAFALRCGNLLVNREMQDFQVRDRCGDPFWTESYTSYDLLRSHDTGQVAREVQYARRMFGDNGWPVIDVTRRSIEETAAAVIRLHQEYRSRGDSAAAGAKPI